MEGSSVFGLPIDYYVDHIESQIINFSTYHRNEYREVKAVTFL